MTLFFDNHEIKIYRSRRKGNADRYGMSATFTAYRADIQPADQIRLEMVNGRFGSTFVAFVEASVDIKEGDIVVTTSNNKRYGVRGVSRWDGAGLLDHLELILVAQDA